MKRNKIPADAPTLFDLSTCTATTKRVSHPDDIDCKGVDLHPKACQHQDKMTSATGWICKSCFQRWEDAGEEWAIARLRSLSLMKQNYRERIGNQSPATIKRYEEAIAQLEVEENSLQELIFVSPVVSPVVSLLYNGRNTGEKIYQWCEEYLKNGRTYLRYCCAPNRISPAKKIHIRGGESTSIKVLSRREMIEAAIKNGKSPIEIEAMIKEFT